MPVTLETHSRGFLGLEEWNQIYLDGVVCITESGVSGEGEIAGALV